MKRILRFLPFVFILCYFLIYSSFPLWDPDFWWHINTGKYILKHKALLEEDPFTFTTPEGESLRKTSILKGYWLSQVLLYIIYKSGGVSGIVLFRSFLLALTLLLVYLFLRDANPYLSLLSITLIGSTLFYFTGERPQTLTFPLVILMFSILEGYREHKSKIIFFLPLITLIWTNLHGSVLFAMGIIIIYLCAANAAFLLTPQSQMDKRNFCLFSAVCLSALLTSLISPVGFKQITAFYSFYGSILQKSTVEFYSPLKLMLSYGKYFSYYWLSLLVVMVITVTNLKRLNLLTIFVVISTIALSLISARYIVFFILSTPILFANLKLKMPNDKFKWSILTLSVVLVIIGSLSYLHPFNFKIRSTYPLETVETFKDTHRRRIFTPQEWGGFIAFHLLPETKVFIDGRTLDENAFVQYNVIIEGTEFGPPEAKQKEWKNLLDRYNVDMIVLPWNDLVTGMPVRLIERLRNSRQWRMAFFNENEVVFIRYF